jgi:hypothetical protein
MAFDGVEAMIVGSSLQLKWNLLQPEARAISIQVATDSNFTRNLNHFIVPTSASFIGLDVGRGEWYFRLGHWSGKDQEGDVYWTATYGPALVVCTKPSVAPPPAALRVLHSFPIPGGIHFNSNIDVKNLTFVEICKDSTTFEANNTNMKYYLDWGTGGFDIHGLDPVNVYAMRVTKFPTGVDAAAFPTSSVYHLPASVSIGSKRPLRIGRRADGGALATSRADNAVLRDAATRPTMKFSSQGDYLRFLATKTVAHYR